MARRVDKELATAQGSVWADDECYRISELGSEVVHRNQGTGREDINRDSGFFKQ